MADSTVKRRNAVLCLMFFFSGLCCLLYETVWLRLTFAEFGVITPVVSVVVSVFMAGLGLGSWLAGKYISWLKQKTAISAIAIYGCLEIIIGLGAFLVPWLLKQNHFLLLTVGEMSSWLYLCSSAIAIAIAILPWTIAMGATYPTILAFQFEFADKDERQFGRLYAANTAGAALGVMLTVIIFVEMLGFKRTLISAAAVNFLIGITAILWGMWRHSHTHIQTVLPKSESKTEISLIYANPSIRNFSFVILFVTGFCSMAMEIIWVRAFSPILGSLVYSFATLLVIYLSSNWLGAFLYRSNLAHNNVKSKNLLLIAVALSSTFTLLAINSDFARMWVNFLGFDLGTVLLLIVCLAAFPMFLGYLTPLLVDDVANGSPAEAGRAYAINIIGCILGPLVGCYLILPTFGTGLGLILTTLPLLALVLLTRNREPSFKISLKTKSVIAGITAVIFLTSFLGKTWEDGGFLKIEKGDKIKLYRDYAATTISIDGHGHKCLIVNGSPMTGLCSTVKYLAHLPLAFLNSPPQSVLVICFGMGTTFRSALSWGVKTTAVELLPSVKEAFYDFHADAAQVLKNSCGHIVIDDGRRFLQRTQEKFDLITIDPPPPISASGSSLLYSVEFFRLIKTRLRTGGLLMEWYFPARDKLNFEAVVRSFVESFPYVKIFGPQILNNSSTGGYYILASERPIVVPTIDQFFARMPVKAKNDLQEWCLSANPAQESRRTIAQILSSQTPVDSVLDPDSGLIITDDHPFNEYFYLRQLTNRQVYLTDRPAY